MKRIAHLILIFVFLGITVMMAQTDSGFLTPPEKPEVFFPGVISLAGSREFSMNLYDNKGLFVRFGNSIPDFTAFETEYINGKWQTPVKSIQFQDSGCYLPCVSQDGEYFYFIDKESTKHYPPKIWMMKATDPENKSFICCGMHPSVSRDKTLYYESNGRFYKRKFENGKYSRAERLKGDIHTFYEDAHPCISWDESYLIFDSSDRKNVRDNDLFLSYKTENDKWSKAFNLGQFFELTNSGLPKISTDGRILTFHSNGDIYWVSTDTILLIIDQLKTNQTPTL